MRGHLLCTGPGTPRGVPELDDVSSCSSWPSLSERFQPHNADKHRNKKCPLVRTRPGLEVRLSTVNRGRTEGMTRPAFRR